MKSFKDKTGRSWDIELNVGAARKLKSRCGLDFDHIITFDRGNRPRDVSALEKLAEDSLLLFEVIFVLCQKQIAEAGLDEDAFAELFDGDTIEAATEALLDEIVNFSRPAQRKVLLQLRKISKNYSEKAGRELEKILNDPRFEQEIEKSLTQSLTNAPASLEE
mgnify:CR=1 FL=1